MSSWANGRSNDRSLCCLLPTQQLSGHRFWSKSANNCPEQMHQMTSRFDWPIPLLAAGNTSHSFSERRPRGPLIEVFFMCISAAELANHMRLLCSALLQYGRLACPSLGTCLLLRSCSRSRRQVANESRSSRRPALNGNSGFNHSKLTRTHRSASAFRSNHAAITVTCSKHASVSATTVATSGNI